MFRLHPAFPKVRSLLHICEDKRRLNAQYLKDKRSGMFTTLLR